MSDLVVTLMLLAVIAAVTMLAASILRTPHHRLSARHGSPHRRDIDRPHRQAVQHFASGALPPWR